TLRATLARPPRPRGAAHETVPPGRDRYVRSCRFVLQELPERGLATLVVGTGRAEGNAGHLCRLGDRQILVEHQVQHLALAPRQRGERRDRKSTRLNSSHV